jgi:O-antigen ligase
MNKPAADHTSSAIGLGWILAFVAFLPFDRFFSELALVGLALHTAIQYRKGDRPKLSWRTILLLQSVFLVTVVSTIWTSHPQQAFSFWTRQLAIFLLPLLFAFSRVDLAKARDRILLTLVATCCFSLAFCYVEALRVILYFERPWKELFSDRFLNHRFAEPIGLHATYFSLYAALAALVLLSRLRTERARMRKILHIGLLLFLLAGLVQLGSRSILIALVLIGTLVYPFFYLPRSGYPKYFLIVLPILVLALVMAGRSPSMRSRLFTDLQADLAREKGAPLLGSRAERWTIACELAGERPVAGWGAGSEVAELKERYYDRRMYSAFLHDLNAHNQYLSFAVKSGIPGLLVYLFTLGIGFRIARKNRSFLLISISENILDVNKGIFFYAFFFPLLIVVSKKKAGKTAEAGNRRKAQLVSNF